ncbi:MAG: S41 family peptidase [Prevotella sp.]|nr:S41 family peptidase [Prevotella sp.]
MSDGLHKLNMAMTIIERTYVDAIDDKKLSEDALTAILEKLDPHSSYVKADELRELNEPLEGNFDGIGVSFNMMSDTLYIIETIAGGPSEKVGIFPGDRIIQVNDTLIAGVKMTTKNIMKRLRGPKGTRVDVKVMRRGVTGLLDFRITRDRIPIYSLDASYMINDKTGYIKLSRFGATTYREFKEAFAKLQLEGMENLILDLQGNGGGYLSTAIDLANEFLGKDKLIVYTEGKHQPRMSEYSKSTGLFEKGKLVVLVNEGSASASEIVSGAIQDWDRGVIVGRRTFGKGLVQRQFPLLDGSALRLTVARYYTPTGRSIQKPYTNGDKGAYNDDLINRYNRGEMMSADSIHFPDSLEYKTMVNQRIVHGGGGIMPDYFVPIDTLTKFHQQLIAKGLIQRIYLLETDNRRKELLAAYPSVESYKNNYTVSGEMLDKLLKLAEDEKIKFDEAQYTQSKPLIALQIKALIAQNLYDAADYYKIINDESPIFKKGIEVISNDRIYVGLLSGKKDRYLSQTKESAPAQKRSKKSGQ